MAAHSGGYGLLPQHNSDDDTRQRQDQHPIQQEHTHQKRQQHQQRSPAFTAATGTTTTTTSSTSPSTSTSFSSFTFLSLAEATFTPLSLDSSDLLSIGSADDGDGEQALRSLGTRCIRTNTTTMSDTGATEQHTCVGDGARAGQPLPLPLPLPLPPAAGACTGEISTSASASAAPAAAAGPPPPPQAPLPLPPHPPREASAMADKGTATAASGVQWPASIRATTAPKRGYGFLSPTSPEMSSDHSGHSIHSTHSLTLSSFSSAATSPPVELDDDANFEHSSLLRSAKTTAEAVTATTAAADPESDNLTRRSARQRLSQLLLGSDATTAPVPERPISQSFFSSPSSSSTSNTHNQNINRSSIHSIDYYYNNNNNNNNNNNTNNTTLPLVTATTTAATTLIRPLATGSSNRTREPLPPPPPVIEPAIVRTASTREKLLPLLHPAPDTNPRARSGAYVGNIAQLENTAEQFSRSGSIEIAIREAHQELKRSDSRRSSILAASVRSLALENGSGSGSLNGADATSAPPHLLAFSRQSSVVELNSVARNGGYSPSGYVMSPAHSLSSARLRSASKTSASGSLAPAPTDGLAAPPPADVDGFPFLSRHGPGKASVRSTHSGKMSLPEIVEYEPPMTLTLEALDEADRIMAEGEDHDDDDTIRASAHQHIDFDFDGPEDPLDLTPQGEPWPPRQQPMPPPRDYLGYGNATQPGHLPNPLDYQAYQPADNAAHADDEPPRPTTSGSGETYEQAQTAFGDFDGVHYNPDHHVDFPEIREPEPQPAPKPRGPPPPRPTSYFDPGSGQQMLYYPARVPAMLNLPPKLSKNPKASAERTRRRTQILSAMPEATRQSRVWLPDPLLDGSDLGSPLIDLGDRSAAASDSGQSPLATTVGSDSQPSPMLPLDPAAAAAAAGPSASSTTLPAADQQQQQPQAAPATLQYRRPPRLTDADRRKSRMSTMDALPSQLRASVFFDLPATTSPQIEVKNGSAMDTLESILDAAATAPVSAFTDHAYAGKLGSEVYGAEKKRKKKKKSTKAKQQQQEAATTDPYAAAQLRASTALEAKKRSSFLSLVGHSRKNSEPLDVAAAERRSMLGADGIANDEASPGLSHSGELLSPGLSEGGGGALAPDEDEDGSEEGSEYEDDEDGDTDEEEDEVDAYVGPPTTLLAELQLRKQQQKLRTRPVHKAFPNGLHSTLLELDAVAEVERKARRGKKVNLAWEDPSLNPDGANDDDDEDVPLGMLFAARAAAGGGGAAADISAVAAELNRPLGLMEKKALDDNEPLSRRRDRLQGRDPGLSMYLSAAHPGLGAKRQSTLTLTPTIAALHSAGQISPGAAAAGAATGTTPPPPEEIEGETLGERRRRLKGGGGQDDGEELPRARPVSTAFTAELLGQFADPEEEAKEKAAAAAKGKENAPPPAAGDEEEETLGQRRKRLQAEREAREREMMMGGGGSSNNLPVNGQALQALTGSDRLSKRLSMADVLAAHPRGSARGAVDPREMERRWREEEAARAARDRDAKMAHLRAQMPSAMSATSLGGGVYKPGGFLGGRFNDGLGGGIGAPPTTYADGPGVGPWANGIRSSVALSGGYAPVGLVGGGGGPGPVPVPPAAVVPLPGYPTVPQRIAGGMPMAMGMGMGIGIPGQHGQPVDMVERWRQGVSPS